MIKAVLLSLLVSLPVAATVPSELQQLFDRAHYQQLLLKIDNDAAARRNPDIMLLQVRTLIQQQFREEANTILNELVTQFPEHSGVLTLAALNKLVLANTGSVFHARKRATDAVELLQLAITLEPTNYQAQQALINFYQSAPASAGGSKELAAARAEELTVINRVQGALAKVTIAVNEGRPADALQLLEHQLAITPDNTDLLLRKAALLTQQSAFLVAQETYMRALPLLNDPVQRQATAFQIGRLGVFSGRHHDEAIAALEGYIAYYNDSQQPRLPRAKLRLAQLYLHRGDIQKAQSLYSHIAQLASDEADFIEARASLQQQLTTR